MFKRRFPVLAACALVVVLSSAGTSRAQFGGFWGGWGAMSPWSGTGNWTYWPGGIGINYMPGPYSNGGFFGPMNTVGLGMYGGYPSGMMSSMYGVPSSVAFSPMTYVAYYPPVYTTRAPVAAPAPGGPALLPADLPATVEVIVPDGAVVRFDGKATQQTGAHRVFTTPPLVKGESYHYDVEATFTRDGKRVTERQRVPVFAGGHAAAVFPTPKK